MFKRILIANRGEIALRIIRCCREMDVETVIVYSTADKDSLAVMAADKAVCIGPAKAAESYLNQDAIIETAILTGCEAVHPGYGFLSENAAFARKCEENNLIFIGPSADIISSMGDKQSARQLMIECGVPVVPGSDGLVATAEEAAHIAERIGYPVLIKASAGGGGKGMRKAFSREDIENAFETAKSEAKAAFGNDDMYIEKLIINPRHIEIQILADKYGNVIHLGERDCSIQRNHQKLIEESPSPGVTKEKRAELFEAATKAAKAVGYVNAGTVEFLMDRDKNFYFMEMNTRLQVEHPVSELVTGKDIVKWQIRIAAGVELDCTQADIKVRGAAIECRINAGGVGKVNFLHIPSGPWVRFDTFLYQGYEVPPFYDSMLGKMIVFSSTREEAIRKMQSALCELVIGGLPNNIEDQIDIIRDPVFHSGDYYTDFIKNREG